MKKKTIFLITTIALTGLTMANANHPSIAVLLNTIVNIVNNTSGVNDIEMTVNQETLAKVDGGYVIDPSQLTGEATLEASTNVSELNEISTIDIVYLMKGISEDNLTPIQAIAADRDKSGSVTTKDIFDMWELILGIRAPEQAGLFIVPTTEDFSNFDKYDFDHKYGKYVFDGTSVGENLDVEVFQYLNISDANSTIH